MLIAAPLGAPEEPPGLLDALSYVSLVEEPQIVVEGFDRIVV